MSNEPTILIVDDDHAVLAALCVVLELEGFHILPAENGREAIEKFRDHRVDLLLLDLNLPVKDGWTALERISAINPLVPIIIITARPAQYPRAATARVDAIMEKPLDFHLLLVTVRELLGHGIDQRIDRLKQENPGTRLLHHEV
jgi:DNA-binding response OmpR family regulator